MGPAVRYDEWVEGLARVGHALMAPTKKSAPHKSMVEILDEILNKYLLPNASAIYKMKESAR